jgi:hypothetical protein
VVDQHRLATLTDNENVGQKHLWSHTFDRQAQVHGSALTRRATMTQIRDSNASLTGAPPLRFVQPQAGPARTRSSVMAAPNPSTSSPPPDAGRAETRDVVRMDAATMCCQDADEVYRRRAGIRGAITPFARRCGSGGPVPLTGDPTACEEADKSVDAVARDDQHQHPRSSAGAGST